MSHKAQHEFCKHVKKLYPKHFKRISVIDVGSLDINGNNRSLFVKCHYIGVDIVAGKNVDVVGPAHESLPALKPKDVRDFLWNPHFKRIEASNQFDTIISTEALEHDKYIVRTLTTMFNKLGPGGLLLITCAGDGREEHGTNNSKPEDSPCTNDYYRNVSNEMFANILPASLFSTYYLNQNQKSCDLQFYGLKNTNPKI